MNRRKNSYFESPYPDPLVRHCPHHRCRRIDLCRYAGARRYCLALRPLRRSLVNRLMARLERQIG
jgi:hypothetical protein